MAPSSPQTVTGSKKKEKELTYEAAFTELEAIVAALEAEGRPLDESLSMYARGQALAAHCAELLEKAELEVRHLGMDGKIDFDDGQA